MWTEAYFQTYNSEVQALYGHEIRGFGLLETLSSE